MIIAMNGEVKMMDGKEAEICVEAVNVLMIIYGELKEHRGEEYAEEQLEKIYRLARMSREEIKSRANEERRKRS